MLIVRRGKLDIESIANYPWRRTLRSWKFWAAAAGALLAVFVIISLLSFDHRDGDYYPKSSSVYNFGGKAGALLSLWLYKWFGLISYFLPCGILLLIFLAVIKKHTLSKWGTWLLWMGIATGWSCIFASYLEQGPLRSYCMPSYGGVFGLYWLYSLQRCLGNRGTSAVVICGTLLLIFWGISLRIEYNIGKGKSQQPTKKALPSDGM